MIKVTMIAEYTTHLGNFAQRNINIIDRIIDKAIIPIMMPATLENVAPKLVSDYLTVCLDVRLLMALPPFTRKNIMNMMKMIVNMINNTRHTISVHDLYFLGPLSISPRVYLSNLS